MYILQQISYKFLKKKVNLNCIWHTVVLVYVMCVMVMECTVQYREICYGISICNVCNGDGVYGTV